MISNITVKETTVIYPADETPNHTINLTCLDSILRLPYSHTPFLYVYNPNNNPTKNQFENYFDKNVLKSSLSKVLVQFYPLAGRLCYSKNTNGLAINCNAEGVVFIEAETTHTLNEFGEFTPSNEVRKTAFPTAPFDYSKGLSSFPLVTVQLTRYRCGGASIGYMLHHNLLDGVSLAHFIRSWSRLAKCVGLDYLPLHDRLGWLGPRNPPQIEFRHREYEPPLGFSGNADPTKSTTTTTTCDLFKFSKQQITTLKLQAISPNPEAKQRLSTYAVIAAHVWRCVCKARGLPSEQEVRLYIPINGRSRLDSPKLPKGYFGNVLFRGLCIAKAGDVACKPLWYIANMVQEALRRMNNEYLRSAIDYLALHPELSGLNPKLLWIDQEKSPNLSINSWIGIPYEEADFGWGKPSFIRLGGVGCEGQTLIMPSLNGDGSLSVSINLSVSNMIVLKKCIYDFGDLHASL